LSLTTIIRDCNIIVRRYHNHTFKTVWSRTLPYHLMKKSALLVLPSSYKAVMSLTSISKVTSMNLCQNTSLCWIRFSRYFSVPWVKFLHSTSNQATTNSFPIHDSLLIPSFHTEKSEQLTASIYKTINELTSTRSIYCC